MSIFKAPHNALRRSGASTPATTSGRSSRWRFLTIITVLACISVAVPATTASAAPPAPLSSAPTAAALPMAVTAGFEIDGNTPVDAPGNLDWATTGMHIVDGADDATQYDNEKEFLHPSTWDNAAGISPKKTDFTDAWIHSQTVSGDVWAYFAFQRADNDGTVNYDLEFNQLANSSDSPARPVRTVNDLMLDVQQGGNGGFEIAHAYLWTLTSDAGWTTQNGKCREVDTYSPAAGWCEIPVPAGAFDSAISADKIFAEGALNLSALFPEGTCSGSYGTVNMRSRSSSAQDASLKDYVVADVSIPSTCGQLTIRKLDPQGQPAPGATFQVTPDPTPGGSAANISVTDGGAGDDDATANGTVVLSPIEPGTYTVTETAPPTGMLLPPPGERTQQVTVGEAASVTITFSDPHRWVAPTLTKTAEATYAARYDWTIEKTVDKGRWNVPDGTPAKPTYAVTVTAGPEQRSDYTVEGSLAISNPNPRPMVVTVGDELADGTSCEVAGSDADAAAGEQRSLPAGASSLAYTCTYAQEPASLDGSNTATLTWSRATYPQSQADVDNPGAAPQGKAEATKAYSFARASRTDEQVTVTDSLKGSLGTLDWDDVRALPEHKRVFGYVLDFDGEPGKCTTYDNTASVTETDSGTDRTDNASVEVCVGLDLTVAKTVAVAYDRTYNWDIDKRGPANVFVGDDGKATVDYEIDVTALPTTDSAATLGGTITVTNPNAWPMTADVTDVFTLGGNPVTCTVSGGDDAVVPANGRLDLAYTCTLASGSWPDNYHGTNSVTVTWDKDVYFSPAGSATYLNEVEDGETTERPANRVIDLVDEITRAGGDPTTVTLNPSRLDWVEVWGQDGHKRTIDASVQLDTGLAADACTTYENMVAIDGTDISDTVTTEVCRPKISKTVKAEYGRTYKWRIAKDVDRSSAEIGPDGAATFHYTVTATPDGFTDGTATWTGTIAVANPSSTAPLTTTVADVSGVQGWTCAVTGDPTITVDPGTTANVGYTCTGDASTHPDGKNTARAGFGGKTVEVEVPVSFVKVTDVNRTITVTDPKAPEPPYTDGVLGTVTWDEGAKSFGYDWTAPAGALGACQTYDNTATIEETGQHDSEQVKVCREAPLEVTKTATGSFDRSYQWKIAKAADQTRVEIRDGQSYDFHYTVDVTKDGFTDSGWEVHGKITVHNPNGYADGGIVADVTDELSGVTGGACTVTGGKDLELAPGATKELDYTCTFERQPGAYFGANTAKAAWTDPDGKSATATGTAPVSLEVDEETHKSVDVYDDKTAPGEKHLLGTSTWEQGPFQYTYTVTKSGVAGRCTTYTNIAVLEQTEQQASETVELCVVKTPTAAGQLGGDFARGYAWSITKEADQTRITAGLDGKAIVNYVVSATPGAATDSGWRASGSATVSNPNEFKALTAGVSVTLDVGGSATCTAAGSPVTVPAGQTVSVPISCAFPGSGYRDGTATVSVDWAAGSPVVTQVPVHFALTKETDKTVTVTDDKAGTVGAPETLGTATWNATGQPTLFRYALTLSAAAGQCETYTNIATIVETKQSAGEQVTVCTPQTLPNRLTMKATVDAACVTPRYGEALVTAVNDRRSTRAGSVRIRAGKLTRSLRLKPGASRKVHLTGLRTGTVVRVTVPGGGKLARAKVPGGCKIPTPPPHTGFRAQSAETRWAGGRLVVPAAGVSARLVSTTAPRVPLTGSSLGRAYFWAGDGEPGGPGSVLVALHSNRGGWAAGNRLPSLRKGATFRVALASGKVLRYRVTRATGRAPLSLSEKRMAELRSNLGPSQLVLTTCNKWALGAGGQYRFRSLAYARLLS